MFPKIIFVIASIALLIIFCLGMARALIGPTVFDRILAVNMIGTKTVLFIAVFGFLTGRPEFLDISLLYALINFVGVIAILKFIKREPIEDTPVVKEITEYIPRKSIQTEKDS